MFVNSVIYDSQNFVNQNFKFKYISVQVQWVFSISQFENNIYISLELYEYSVIKIDIKKNAHKNPSTVFTLQK